MAGAYPLGELCLAEAECSATDSRIEGEQDPTTVQTLRRLTAALDTHLVVGFAHEIPGLQSTGTSSADLVAVG